MFSGYGAFPVYPQPSYSGYPYHPQQQPPQNRQWWMKERHDLKLHVPLRTVHFALDLEKWEKDAGIKTKEHNFLFFFDVFSVVRTVCAENKIFGSVC
jgi:hypothetical protein